MFDEIQPLYLAWGLYLSVCWENNLPYDTETLPYDKIAGYDLTLIEGNNRLYGGEIGIFEELQNNVKMLHEIYEEMRKNNTISEITKTEPLYLDIKNGVGTSGKNWAKAEKARGSFEEKDLPFIQTLLASEEGISIQKSYLFMRLYTYHNKNRMAMLLRYDCSPQAKTLLCTYILKNPNIVYWYDEVKDNVKTLEEMANFLLGILELDDKRILSLFEYIRDNLEGIV